MTNLDQRILWSNAGSDLLLACLSTVSDEEFEQDSTLPGWTVGHLVAHVAYNATALSRLMHWAATGRETRMYPSPEARNAEIEEGATLPPDRLRRMVQDSDSQLRAEYSELAEDAWHNEVITAQGLRRQAADIPWMRAREVWIHAVDLGKADFVDFPTGLIDALITDATTMRQSRGEGPALLVNPTDRNTTWSIEVAGETPHTVEASAVELCRWLTGRATLADAPELGRWL